MENDPVRFKAVVIGESNVGKTSLVIRLITGTFNSQEPTIGVSNSKMSFNTPAGPVELCIWDTAGQEIFHSLVPLYSRSSSVVILVCSTDVPESIARLTEWVKMVENSCVPLPPIVLALNKIDLVGEDDKTLAEIKKNHPKMFAHEFSCSALTGEGVKELFLCAAIEACKMSGMKVPDDPKEKEKKKGCC